MRIAVLSDIHANYYALKAVLKDIDSQKVDGYWCLGDSAGRGFQPIEVLKELHRVYKRQSPQNQLAWLCGNHEMMLLDRIPHGKMSTEGESDLTVTGDNIFAAKMIEEHQQLLQSRPNILDWLRELPTYRHQPYPNIYMAHAAYVIDDEGKVDEDETFRPYLLHKYEVKDMLRRLKMLGRVTSGLVLSGHTHISGLWRWDDGDESLVHYPDHQRNGGYTFDLQRELVFVNPGSAGFPRKSDRCPTYAILTTEDNFRSVTVEFFTSHYDPSSITFPYSYPEPYRDEMLKCHTHD